MPKFSGVVMAGFATSFGVPIKLPEVVYHAVWPLTENSYAVTARKDKLSE